jgi:hypothetical protein
MTTKKHHFFTILSFVFLFSIIYSCTTDDVLPSVESFTSSEDSFSEENGTVTIAIKLNGLADKDIEIPLNISSTATNSEDYTLSASQITISKGSDNGAITITSIDDNLEEAIETIEITIAENNNVILFGNNTLVISLLDNDADTDGDGVVDSEDDCPEVAGDLDNNGCPFLGFIINEFLYDPAAGLDGDANGDGIRDPNDDEFIEFYNSGPALDISGYKVFDETALASNSPRHIFPAGTIVPANGSIVLFGGGNPTGNFGGSLVQIASGGQLNISNAGDLLTIQDATGNVILTLDVEPLSDNPDESYSRNPDLVGEYVQHSTIVEANGALFSPGRKVDGSSF